ncbi:hypothetical protein SAMN05421837_1011341 [Amycolatopsis pretoriensis]|uniref:Uncharacterized protein n=1 Tax=Amycolatopsis pretoriensis TaxID=218821 RepID=A0A1H5Q8I9_9PSEU|nr:hypothetical protein [Amycolatopsis pretoriensis]SEF22355.1 hypothetical protein SAMN05421837_1011341 [Amycolatopsis pretoriensis]
MEEDPNDAWHAKPGPADPVLVRAVLTAARSKAPAEALEEVATDAYEAGVTPLGMMRACYAAQDTIVAGAPEGSDDPAYDAVLDLMDRLTGFCPPGAKLEPLPPK